jgi:hypothetical protein
VTVVPVVTPGHEWIWHCNPVHAPLDPSPPPLPPSPPPRMGMLFPSPRSPPSPFAPGPPGLELELPQAAITPKVEPTPATIMAATSDALFMVPLEQTSRKGDKEKRPSRLLCSAITAWHRRKILPHHPTCSPIAGPPDKVAVAVTSSLVVDDDFALKPDEDPWISEVPGPRRGSWSHKQARDA